MMMTRAQQILKRLAEIEQEARRDMKAGVDVVSDGAWKYAPLACEHRALMVEWWTLPSADVYGALYGNRLEWDTWGQLPRIEKRSLLSRR